MGIADTIKGWFGSGKNAGGAHTGELTETMKSNLDTGRDQAQPGMNKINDGIDTAGAKLDDMSGGRAGDMIDKGTDAANDSIDKMGKQNP
jgi:hypothetical protein